MKSKLTTYRNEESRKKTPNLKPRKQKNPLQIAPILEQLNFKERERVWKFFFFCREEKKCRLQSKARYLWNARINSLHKITIQKVDRRKCPWHAIKIEKIEEKKVFKALIRACVRSARKVLVYNNETQFWVRVVGVDVGALHGRFYHYPTVRVLSFRYLNPKPYFYAKCFKNLCLDVGLLLPSV